MHQDFYLAASGRLRRSPKTDPKSSEEKEEKYGCADAYGKLERVVI